MIKLPEGTNIQLFVEEKLCGFFGVKFVKDYDSRAIRRSLRGRYVTTRPGERLFDYQRQRSLPYPVHEIVERLFMHGINTAYDRAYYPGYRYAYEFGNLNIKERNAFGEAILTEGMEWDDDAPVDEYASEIAFPGDQYEKVIEDMDTSLKMRADDLNGMKKALYIARMKSFLSDTYWLIRNIVRFLRGRRARRGSRPWRKALREQIEGAELSLKSDKIGFSKAGELMRTKKGAVGEFYRAMAELRFVQGWKAGYYEGRADVSADKPPRWSIVPGN